jgi:hypothetical protein
MNTQLSDIKVGDIVKITYGDYYNGDYPDRYAIIIAPLHSGYANNNGIGEFFYIKMLDNMEKVLKLTASTFNDRWFKTE